MGCCCKKPSGDNPNDDLVVKTLAASSEPLKSEQIAEACGLDKDTVSKCITKLKENGKIVSPKRCYYALPEPKTE